jgi:hypothetical protein
MQIGDKLLQKRNLMFLGFEHQNCAHLVWHQGIIYNGLVML